MIFSFIELRIYRYDTDRYKNKKLERGHRAYSLQNKSRLRILNLTLENRLFISLLNAKEVQAIRIEY